MTMNEKSEDPHFVQEGVAGKGENMKPLFNLIAGSSPFLPHTKLLQPPVGTAPSFKLLTHIQSDHVPAPKVGENEPFQMLATQIFR